MIVPKRLYFGWRDEETDECIVEVLTDGDIEAQPLPARRDLRDHGSGGFEWSYGGSGSTQLALAILADHFCAGLGNSSGTADALALRYYQKFKRRVVARLVTDAWRLTTDDIENSALLEDPFKWSRMETDA
jgi:hypothetical protein